MNEELEFEILHENTIRRQYVIVYNVKRDSQYVTMGVMHRGKAMESYPYEPDLSDPELTS